MKNLKKIDRKKLSQIKGGALLPEVGNCCGSWCNGSWMSCDFEHFACPDGADTNPPSNWDGHCPL